MRWVLSPLSILRRSGRRRFLLRFLVFFFRVVTEKSTFKKRIDNSAGHIIYIAASVAECLDDVVALFIGALAVFFIVDAVADGCYDDVNRDIAQ